MKDFVYGIEENKKEVLDDLRELYIRGNYEEHPELLEGDGEGGGGEYENSK